MILQIDQMDYSVCYIYKYADNTRVVNTGNDPSSTDIQVAADELYVWLSSNKI